MKNGNDTPTVAVVSYNQLPSLEKVTGYDNRILVLSETFIPKCPENVKESDVNWQHLLKYKQQLERIIIFAGKKSSGALEIIQLAATSLADKKDCILFIFCDHELDEKIEFARLLGFHDTQYICFKDGHTQCQEAPLLQGFAYQHLLTHQ